MAEGLIMVDVTSSNLRKKGVVYINRSNLSYPHPVHGNFTILKP
jgi:hypothetical protein